MATAGLYSIGGSFWEFGEPDWDRTKYLLLFGVAEDHDSNPIKTGLAKLKARGAKFVSINPVQTGYSALADEFLAIRPGTDGLFVLALVHELLRTDRIDLDFLASYSNAIWLVIDNPGGRGRRSVRARCRRQTARLGSRDRGADRRDPPPTCARHRRHLHPARRTSRAPVFQLLAERYLDGRYAPDAVADRCGIPAATIQRIATEIADVAFHQAIELDQSWTDTSGRRHEKMIGRPVAMHAMRGISAHSNGFQTCRALHLLQMLLGAIDTPGVLALQVTVSRNQSRPRPVPWARASKPMTPCSRHGARLPARAARPAAGG